MNTTSTPPPPPPPPPQYSSVTPLILFYHRIPHLYTNLTKLPPTAYSPFNQLYIESLGLIATLPALVLIILLLNLLIYLTSFCCCRQRRSNCFGVVKVGLFLGVIGCCALTGLSLYLNDELNESVRALLHVLHSYEENLAVIRNRTAESLLLIETVVESKLRSLQRHYTTDNSTTPTSTALLHYISAISANLSHGHALLSALSSSAPTVSYAAAFASAELYRWTGLLGFYIVSLLVHGLLLYGLLRSSRCSFIAFSVAGLVLLIVNWCIASGWLVLAVASADTCISPHLCPTCSTPFHHPHPTPSLPAIQSTLDSVRSLTKSLRSAHNPPGVELDISDLFESYSSLEHSCSAVGVSLAGIGVDWTGFRSQLCTTTLPHLHWLLVVGAGLCGLLGFVVYVDSWTWIYLIQQQQQLKSGSGGWRSTSNPSPASRLLLLDDKQHQQHPQQRHSRGTGCPPPPGGRFSHSHASGDLFGGGGGGRGTATLDHRPPALGRTQNGKYKTLNKNCKLLEAADYY